MKKRVKISGLQNSIMRKAFQYSDGITTEHIYKSLYEIPFKEKRFYSVPLKIRVSVSKSIKKLIKRGLLKKTGIAGMAGRKTFISRKIYALTKKGKEYIFNRDPANITIDISSIEL